MLMDEEVDRCVQQKIEKLAAELQADLDRIEAVMRTHLERVPCACGAEDGSHLEYCPAHPERAAECYRGEWPVLVTGNVYRLNLDRDQEGIEPEVVRGPTWRTGSWQEYREWMMRAYRKRLEANGMVARWIVRGLKTALAESPGQTRDAVVAAPTSRSCWGF